MGVCLNADERHMFLKVADSKHIIDMISFTSLGGVKVPSTSNRHRIFRSEEKTSDFSISSSLTSLSVVLFGRFS